MALAVTAANEEQKRGILFVANYCGYEDKVSCQLGDETSTVTSSGDAVAGFNTVCGVVATAAGKGPQLLGETPEAQALVEEWATFRHTHLTPLTDDNLRKLNERLLTRTYVAGGSLPSLADLVLFDAVYPAVTKFPSAQTLHFCNLLRWWDLLQHTADIKSLYQPLQLQKPRFEPPPPPAAKPSAGGGGDSKGAASATSGTSSATAAAPAAAAASPSGAKADGKGGVAAAAGKAGAKAAAAPAVVEAAAAAADGGAAKGDKKDKKKKEKAPAAPAAQEVGVDLADIRVGTIVEVGKHPNADSLYLEQIDVGEEAPRQVVSGLVKFVPEDKMRGRRVVVVCNLKPAKMRDVMSYGMVLCASDDAHGAVDPIVPPEGVPNGERITFEGYGRQPEAQLNPKKKVWDQIAEGLMTDADGVPVYKGVPFMTSKGKVTSTIPNGLVR